VSGALVSALLAAGIGGENAIDQLKSWPDEGKPHRDERTGNGLREVVAPSHEVVLWALKQLSDLATDPES
jgi:hypothetical protein